jgi:HlyD family secretion protein
MKRTRTLVFRGLVLAGVVTVAAVAFWPRPVVVETAPARRAPLVERIDGDARTRVRERYVVTAPVDGEMDRLTLSPGDAVKPGDLVAHIHAGPARPLDLRTRGQAQAGASAARASVAQADAMVRRAASALDEAERELGRREKLIGQGVIAPAEVDAARTEADVRRREHEAARAAAVTARAERERAAAMLAGAGESRTGAVEVRAPIAGRVLRVLRESGGVIAAGTPLVEIGDTAEIELVADFLTSDAMRIRAGAEVLVDRWGGDEPLAARVHRVEPGGFTKVSALGVEEQRVNVLMDFTSSPAPPFGDDYRVRVHITSWRGDDVLQVPATAIFRTGREWVLYAVDGGRARLRIVQPGHTDGAWTELRSGVAPGDVVIVQPSDRVTAGTRVRAAGP